LKQIRFHDLRHTCATLLLSKNVNPKVISEMLGHASIAITLDTYSHVLPTMRESAAKAMEDALSCWRRNRRGAGFARTQACTYILLLWGGPRAAFMAFALFVR
jgi:hypothetical protein